MSFADAIEAHNRALKRGGRSGINDIALIRSAIGRPYTGYYRPIARKAAALVESVGRNHGFIDGNKRTALLLLGLLLDRSGYELVTAANEDINEAATDFILQIAEGQMPYDEIVVWLQTRIRKKSPI